MFGSKPKPECKIVFRDAQLDCIPTPIVTGDGLKVEVYIAPPRFDNDKRKRFGIRYQINGGEWEYFSHVVDGWRPSIEPYYSEDKTELMWMISQKYNTVRKMTTYTVSSTEIKAFGENIRLGSDLLEQSCLVELGSKQETQLC